MSIYNDIRIPKDKADKLLRGNIISRNIISSLSDVIELKNVPLPLATRIFKFTNIQVKCANQNEWINVKNNDIDALKKIYAVNEEQYGVKVSGPIVEMNNSTDDQGILHIDSGNNLSTTEEEEELMPAPIEEIETIPEIKQEEPIEEIAPINEEVSETIEEVPGEEETVSLDEAEEETPAQEEVTLSENKTSQKPQQVYVHKKHKQH